MRISLRFRGCLLGLAVGDAIGTTVEFSARDSFPPVTDMVGGGPFGLPPGAWTDDTSMALCLATSLIECNGFDAKDQMQRYCRWYQEGYLSSTGGCFDIGTTTASALRRFQESGEPYSGSTASHSAGNGCIMRLAPVPMFFYPDREQVLHYSGESSRTTHGSAECIEASRLMGAMLHAAFAGASKDDILFAHNPADYSCENVRAIAEGQYRSKHRNQIASSGYVIHCLEASAWCFWHGNTFAEAVLMAVNLGNDADTTGAVCGQLAGAFYGEEAIPAAWRERLVMAEEIGQLAERLMKTSDTEGV
jgi:ADP-ribosyl-[dinitrogen reductase] hydrolase